MAIKRIRDLTVVNPASSLYVPAEGVTGDTVRVQLGPSTIPIVEGGRHEVRLAGYRHITVRGNTSTGLGWVQVVSISALPMWTRVTGILRTLTLGQDARATETVVFSIARRDTAVHYPYVGIDGPSGASAWFPFRNIQDVAITEDNTTYGVWVYGYWVNGVDAILYGPGETINSATVGLLGSQTNPPANIIAQWLGSNQSVVIPHGTVVSAQLSAAGGYIRYDNGMQEAWAVISNTSPPGGYGTLTDPYWRGVTWTYPAGFAESPAVYATHQLNTVAATGAHATSVSATSATIVAWSGDPMTSASVLHLYATGRWRL